MLGAWGPSAPFYDIASQFISVNGTISAAPGAPNAAFKQPGGPYRTNTRPRNKRTSQGGGAPQNNAPNQVGGSTSAAQHTAVGVADSRHAHTLQSSIVAPGSPQPNKHGVQGRSSHDTRSGDGDNNVVTMSTRSDSLVDESMVPSISSRSGGLGKDLSIGQTGAPRHRRTRRKDDEGIPPIPSLQHGAQRGTDPMQTNQLSSHHRPTGAQFDLEEASFPPLPGK